MTGVQTCARSEEHTSELQSHDNLVCRLLLAKKHQSARGRRGRPPRRVSDGVYTHARRAGRGPRPPFSPRAERRPLAACSKPIFFLNGAAPPKPPPLPPPSSPPD